VENIVYIDAPEALTKRQRTATTVVTGIMWAVYAYLWLPLISLFAWGLGFELAYYAVMRAGGASALLGALFWYAVMLVDVILTVAIWSLLNKWRFANRNRRTAHPRVPDTAMAGYFGVVIKDLERLRGAHRIELDLDALGRPVVRATDVDAGFWPEPRRARRTATR
jgi:biofilm PGA synthesis protein PgaD